MKGTIVERPKGSRNFSIRFSGGFDETTGKYRQIWKSGFTSVTEARKYLNELEYKKNTRTLPRAGRTTVVAYLTSWLRDDAKPSLSPKGYERYESVCRVHIIPAIGQMQLSDLEPKHLRALYLKKQNDGLAPRTVRYIHVIIHKALQDGLEDNIVSRNVADAVKPPKAEAAEIQTWNETELNQFLEAAKHTEYYALFFCDLFTGMRRCELLGLRWKDLDLALGQISVTRGLHQLKDKSFVYTQPKSKKSTRNIALSPAAVDVLENHHTTRTIDAKMMGRTVNNDDLVFCHLDGRPYRPNSVSRAWEHTAKRACVKVIRMHDGRHTHATIMLKQGIHPKVVSERLGHSSIQITLDTYSHVVPGLQEAAAKRFDDVLAPKYNVRVG